MCGEQVNETEYGQIMVDRGMGRQLQPIQIAEFKYAKAATVAFINYFYIGK